MTPTVVIVTGTFNRRALLAAMISSVRRSVGRYADTYRIVVVDGGSTDGTLPWLYQQRDVEVIEQGALLGAVAAFNEGFARAIDLGAPYVCQLNDDLALVSNMPEIERAVDYLIANEVVGAVAFASNRFPDGFDYHHNRLYVNQGVFRRAAGMAAARAQGDETGRAWWSPCYHTYAADTELSCWLWRLGWRIDGLLMTCVREQYVNDGPGGLNDPLRKRNADLHAEQQLWRIFSERWGSPLSVEYNRADAERYGGIIR